MTPSAFSYVRFSSRPQEEGDSVRRQTKAAADWARRTGVHLDSSLSIDRGVSAFKGRNADIGALGEFLRLVESGSVAPGSYLVVESLDRLSRDEVQPALRLILGLLQSGVKIVQLKPVEVVYDRKSDTTALIVMIIELSRANSESKVKSERVGAAWARKKRLARDGVVATRRLPGWLRAEGGKIVPNEHAATVSRIFALAAGGYGLKAITRKLTEDKVPTFGASKSGRWAKSYIHLILTDERATGKYQPRRRDRSDDGEPIPGYYPQVVTPEEFHRARAGAAERRAMPGRTGSRQINVFAGLLRHARDGDTFIMLQRSNSRAKSKASYPVLINHHADDGHARSFSIPYTVFETSILAMLGEVNPGEIVGGDDGAAEVAALSGELDRIEGRIGALVAELAEGDGEVAGLSRALKALEGRKGEVAAGLAAASARAASPAGDAWSTAQALVRTLEGAADKADARLRLRSALRRVVESMWLLIVPRGRDRLACVQVYFKDGHAGKRRDYVIYYRPRSRPAQGPVALVDSLVQRLPTLDGSADFRDAAQAATMAAAMETIDVAPWVEAITAC